MHRLVRVTPWPLPDSDVTISVPEVDASAREVKYVSRHDPEEREMRPPIVETERFTLRGFVFEDVDRLAEILGDPQVMRYMPGDEPWPREAAERELRGIVEHWGLHGYGRWAVVDGEGGEVIGWCGLGFLPEIGETEVAYLLDKDYWNRGIATEAARISLRYGFEEASLERIIALAFPENTASRRVMEKIGMAYEKMIHIWKLDLVQYQISRDMFDPE
jgi:ribosomal-protein-alanine N-acetyltransferase